MADILAFSPHPDDAEIGAGGTLARHCRLGYEVVICDLSEGELASNGSPEVRRREAEEAGQHLGLSTRVNLGLPDRALGLSPSAIRAVTEVVRRFRPRVVLAPFAEDRHPDHGATAALVREAVSNAGLARYPADGEAHRIVSLAHYLVNASCRPDFVVDVSDVYEVKRRALRAHASQFGPGGLETRLNQGYLEWVELRDRWYGSLVGVARAEGFRYEGMMRVDDLTRDL